MQKLTLKRTRAEDPIHINVLVFDPITEHGVAAAGLFDTGNDHTVISKELFDSVGLATTGRQLPVNGVTGSSMALTTFVTIGIEFDGKHKVTIDKHEVAVVDGVSDPVLIGRDFLALFDVTISRDGEFTLER